MTTLPTAQDRDSAPTSASEQLAHLWSDIIARHGHLNAPHRPAPSRAQVDVLRALADLGGESYPAEVARATRRERSNIAQHTLPTLDRLGLVHFRAARDLEEVPGVGRPVRCVTLTATGRRLVEALEAAEREAAEAAEGVDELAEAA